MYTFPVMTNRHFEQITSEQFWTTFRTWLEQGMNTVWVMYPGDLMQLVDENGNISCPSGWTLNMGEELASVLVNRQTGEFIVEPVGRESRSLTFFIRLGF